MYIKMSNDNFKTSLFKLLENDSRLWNKETKELNETLLKDLIDKVDGKLIELLLSEEETRSKFFIKVKDVYVLKSNELKFFIDENKLDNSYTQYYRNKIGLRVGNKLLRERDEVVLDWPFKDCVLEGGMTKEDQKRNEIFFNEVLAKDEIDRLFDKKALINWKRFTKDSLKNGEPVKELKRDENGTIKENLIIKGNNLLALHSLKEQFAGKVKLIYIDPPYNTGNDSFKYNDQFNHSTWMSFMKNRLEVARELMSDLGSIYIQLDYNEVHYGKILMDEIFGRNNFQREIIWKLGGLAGYKALTNNFVRGHETILFYSKTSKFHFNKTYLPYNKEQLKRFSSIDGDGRKYKTITKDKKFYLDEAKGVPIADLWDDIASFQTVVNSQEIMEFDGQKPEKLLKRIVEASSNEDDIVLDYHAGTGTTLAVSHKMKRHYIGIEQMEYIHDLPESRLKKVVEGEQGGISKDVNWQGGGDFIYLELAEWNEKAKRKIKEAKNLDELIKLFDELYERYFLNYTVKVKEFREKTIKEENFINLGLDKQKELFLEMLDLNQLYVNYSEREDAKYGISKEDIALSEAFYNNQK